MRFISGKEEKELILSDVCARLRSGLFLLRLEPEPYEPCYVFLDADYYSLYSRCEVLESIPILRSMSSMTPKEVEELLSLNSGVVYAKDLRDNKVTEILYKTEAIDYLIKHHLDFRGLIKRNLAKEDTFGFYSTD